MNDFDLHQTWLRYRSNVVLGLQMTVASTFHLFQSFLSRARLPAVEVLKGVLSHFLPLLVQKSPPESGHCSFLMSLLGVIIIKIVGCHVQLFDRVEWHL